VVTIVVLLLGAACGIAISTLIGWGNERVSAGSKAHETIARGDLEASTSGEQIDIHTIIQLANKEQWLIKLHDVEKDHVVSKSDKFEVFYGAVFQSIPVALKTITVSEDQVFMCTIHGTLRTLARLRHPNLALFLGIALDFQFQVPRLMLIHEMQMGPRLDVFLQDLPLTSSCNCMLAVDISKCIHYLHSQSPPVLLHNLTPAHVIVTGPADSPKAMIINYGLSALHEVLHTGKESGAVVQTTHQNTPPSIDADKYSFGSILLLLFSRVQEASEIESAIPTMTEQLADQAAAPIELIKACLHCDLARRPSMLEVVRFLEHVLVCRKNSEVGGCNFQHTVLQMQSDKCYSFSFAAPIAQSVPMFSSAVIAGTEV